MDQMIRLSDAWKRYGGGTAPKDWSNPTSAEKRNGAAFYRRLCDKGVLAYKVVNGERFVRESDVARLWDSGSSPETSATLQRTTKRTSTAELRRRFRARRAGKVTA